MEVLLAYLEKVYKIGHWNHHSYNLLSMSQDTNLSFGPTISFVASAPSVRKATYSKSESKTSSNFLKYVVRVYVYVSVSTHRRVPT